MLPMYLLAQHAGVRQESIPGSLSPGGNEREPVRTKELGRAGDTRAAEALALTITF